MAATLPTVTKTKSAPLPPVSFFHAFDTVFFFGIDRMGGAETAGRFQLAVQDIHGNHGISPGKGAPEWR
jgi:hypothetical protein